MYGTNDKVPNQLTTKRNFKRLGLEFAKVHT